MIIPYDYQTMAADKAMESFDRGKPELIVAPTGSGKSIIAAEICHRIKNDPVLILQPSQEILEQNFSKLSQYGIDDMSIYSASLNSRQIGQYTYATIGSIDDKIDQFKHFKYCIVDEAHNVNKTKGMYRKFFKALPKLKVIGMTATPYQMQQRFYLDEKGQANYTAMLRVMTTIWPPYFKGFSFKITNQTMFSKGYLSPIEYRYPRDINIAALPLNTTGADWNDEAMDKYLQLPDNVRRLAEAVVAEDDNAPNNLIFCRSIKQATLAAETVASMGLDCEVIWGNDPLRERKIQLFRTGKIKRLFNAKVLGIGFDYPGLYRVTLGTPTMSLGNLYQWIGRCIRRDPDNPNKVAQVVDVCNNIRRLGRIETIRITQNPITKKDQVETDRGVISDRPLFTFRVTDQRKINLIK